MNFYATLPAPWNRPPAESKIFAPPIDFIKLVAAKTLAQFSGKHAEYARWRGAFLTTVHQQLSPVEYKAHALAYCLEGIPEAEDLTHGLCADAEIGYKLAVEWLEDTYGGDTRALRYAFQRLKDAKHATRMDASSFSALFRTVLAFKATTEKLQAEAFFDSDEVLMNIEFKLDDHLQTLFADWSATQPDPNPSPSGFLIWAAAKTKAMSRASEIRALWGGKFGPARSASVSSAVKPDTMDGFRSRAASDSAVFHTESSTQAKTTKRQTADKTCEYCGEEGHWRFVECAKFLRLPVQKRKDFIFKKKLCFICFGKHKAADCTTDIKCRECQSLHNTLLHVDKPNEKRDKPDPKTGEASSNKKETVTTHSHTTVASPVRELLDTVTLRDLPPVSLRTVSAWVYNPLSKAKLYINILLDDGASTTLVSERVAQALGLRATVLRSQSGKELDLRIKGTGGKITDYAAIAARLVVGSKDDDYRRGLSACIIPQPVGDLMPVDWGIEKNKYAQLTDLPFPPLATAKGVDMLIGVSSKDFHDSLDEVRTPNQYSPNARLTRLGWTAVGYLGGGAQEELDRLDRQLEAATTHAFQAFSSKVARTQLEHGTEIQFDGTGPEADEAVLEDLLRRSWEIDEVIPSSTLSRQDRDALQRLDRGYNHDGSKLHMPILWKRGEPHFRSNLKQAEHRLQDLVKSAKFTPEYRKAYDAVFRKWIDEGVLVEVPEAELAKEHYYLCHFGVDKTGPVLKVRPVMDCALKYRGKSLNDAINPGPNMLNDLVDVLLRFRAKPVAISTDIKDMYLKIGMPKSAHNFHRVLWLDHQEKIKHYAFTCLVFGVNCAPNCACYAIKRHAREAKDRLPLAAQAVQDNTLLDDAMPSYWDTEEAGRAMAEIDALFQEVGMLTHKWAASHPDLLKDIPVERRAKKVELLTGTDGSGSQGTTALGIRWDLDTDEFRYTIAPPKPGQAWTPKQILSHFLRLFDPLGHLSPFVVRARKYFQQIWSEFPRWNKPVPEAKLGPWREWIRDCEGLKDFVMPRSFLPLMATPESKVTLHVFADASEFAYGAAVYAVTEVTAGTYYSRQVMAKAKVTPKDAVSIPRLELTAAILALKLNKKVTKACNYNPRKTRFYTDSMVVLAWINSSSSHWTPFVANRIGYIHDESHPSQWFKIGTKRNPGDIPSRGDRPANLATSRKWLEGPDWYWDPEADPPEQPKLSYTQEVKAELRAGGDITEETAFNARAEMVEKETRPRTGLTLRTTPASTNS